jgi:hypothetical protein
MALAPALPPLGAVKANLVIACGKFSSKTWQGWRFETAAAVVADDDDDDVAVVVAVL